MSDQKENLKSVLQELQGEISLSHLEKQANVPAGMVSKWLRGVQSLPEKYVPNLITRLKSVAAKIAHL